jgi:hypothetical protein
MDAFPGGGAEVKKGQILSNFMKYLARFNR